VNTESKEGERMQHERLGLLEEKGQRSRDEGLTLSLSSSSVSKYSDPSVYRM
jgi:hypothetical protein